MERVSGDNGEGEDGKRESGEGESWEGSRVSYRGGGGAPWDFPPKVWGPNPVSPPEFQDCTMIYQ